MTRRSYLSPSSPRQTAVLDVVLSFGQVSTSHVRRLLFTAGTKNGRETRTRRTMASLVSRGVVSRINRTIGGWNGGGGEHVYIPRDSKAKTPDLHTLDITELYVRIREAGLNPVFEPERVALRRIGGMELKPDAFIDQGWPNTYFIEVDRGTEYRAQLAEKMRRYARAYNKSDEENLPLVVFLAHSTKRVEFIRTVVRNQAHSEFFAVFTFDEGTERIIERLRSLTDIKNASS